MWNQFQKINGGILVVGHGTRVALGVQQLLDLGAQLQQLFGKIPVESGFLELAEPTIGQALNSLRSRGVKCVMVVPILLFEAAHARSDIPDAVHVAAESLGLSILAQSAPLSTADAALALSEFRFVEALRCTNRSGCLIAGGCDRMVECFATKQEPTLADAHSSRQKIGLAMVGRGTSDPVAIDDMRRFTTLRVSRSPIQVSWFETGFFVGTQPTIDQLLDDALHADCDTVVVQPHLLFEGELVRQLREKVEQCQRLSSKCRWLVAPTLGADPQLAKAFFAMASESLEQKVGVIS